jgi:transglutaminase-like putative cysteine protease
VATVDFQEAASQLCIISRVAVNLHALPGLGETHQTVVAYPVVYDDEETLVANAYKAAIYPADLERLTTWLTEAKAAADETNAFAIVATLNRAIQKNIPYVRREEKGVQTPAETLQKRSGSCRDMATLLMEACRALGMAARFCSGYLDCAASVAGHASTHAWMEVYLPGRGWTGFDPTIGDEVSHKHVSIGVSNHPRAVMPISGRFFGTRNDFIAMTVAVKFEKLG